MLPKIIARLALSLALAGLPGLAAAQADKPQPEKPQPADGSVLGEGFWRVMGSPYTIHWGEDEEGLHEPVYMIGAERQRADGWLFGGTYFSNSFGQPSVYFYVGEKVTNFSRWDKLFFQWTVGILYGYKDPYEDKVPFNVNGFSPGATVSLGWQITRDVSVQAIALGTAGLMFQFAFDLR
jgi:hypothetical protein